MTTIPADTPDWLPDIAGSVDALLVNGSVALVNIPPPTYTSTFTLGKSYKALLLSLSPGTPGLHVVSIQLKDPSGNFYYTRTYTFSLASGGSFFPALPAPMTAGGALVFTVNGPTGATTLGLGIYASVDPINAGQGPYRSDGRLYPVGSKAFHGSNAAGETVVAAPGVGSRILLASANLMCQSPAGSASFYYLQGTIGGVVTHIAAAGGATAAIEIAQAVIPPGGLLFDDNTALTTAQAGSPSAVFADGTYDIAS